MPESVFVIFPTTVPAIPVPPASAVAIAAISTRTTAYSVTACPSSRTDAATSRHQARATTSFIAGT